MESRREIDTSKEELEEKEKEALFIIKQDVCSWLSTILGANIKPDTFLSQLDTGVLLCQVVSLIQRQATIQQQKIKTDKNADNNTTLAASRIPLTELQCNKKAKQESFHARDNTANFISWCRQAAVEEAVMFESNDLVVHKDERKVILCLLEVARLAGQVGMVTPKLIELEKEIELMENSAESVQEQGSKKVEEEEESDMRDGGPPKQKKRKGDGLDKKVLMIFNQCTCKNKLQVVSHGFGKFEVTLPSGRRMIVYVRILSDRILVRVGGGWDSIEHFILKHDPCRHGISIMAPSFEKEVKSLAPNVKIVPSKMVSASRPPRKAKQLSPYATPKHSSLRRKNTSLMKSTSTPLLHTTASPRKRKLK